MFYALHVVCSYLEWDDDMPFRKFNWLVSAVIFFLSCFDLIVSYMIWSYHVRFCCTTLYVNCHGSPRVNLWHMIFTKCCDVALQYMTVFHIMVGNVLSLKNSLNLSSDIPEVSQEKLLSLVAERLIESNINTDVTSLFAFFFNLFEVLIGYGKSSKSRREYVHFFSSYLADLKAVC